MEEILQYLRSGGDVGAAVDTYISLTPQEKTTLLEKIGVTRSERVALFLSKILDVTPERDLQKSIKKLLFLLKTQGIRVEEPKISGESVLRKVETVREQMAFLSNYDPEDTRVVLLAFEIKKKQFLFIHAVSHFSKGLIELAAMPLPRNQLDAILQDYRERATRPMVLAPIAPKYASFLLEEASAISGSHADDLRSLKPLMAGLKGPVQKPDDISNLPVPDETRSRSLQAILSDPMVEPFMLAWDSMESDKKELDGAINPSSIVLPPHVVEERRQAFVNDLVVSDKLRSALRLLKRLLQDYAYLFHAAQEFDAFKGIVDGLRDESFVRDALLFFVKKSFEKKEEEKEGVLVDPFKQNPPNPPYPRSR